MLHIHPNARTTPAIRAEIAHSTEPSSTVARRYGISAETVRKWRKRGAANCLDRSAHGQGTFKNYDPGFVPIDIKPLHKPQTADGERRNRYLFVAIDRRSRSVHLAVKDDQIETSAIAFRDAAAALPFRLNHVLADNGGCFTPAFARACAELGAEYRHTKPRMSQTNGMVERFNGRVGFEVLGVTVYAHGDLDQLLRGFNAVPNDRRQRVLDGKTPNQVTAANA